MWNLKARVSDEYKNRLDESLFKRRMSLQEAIIRGLDWVMEEGGDAVVDKGPFGRLTPKQEKILAGVLRILKDQSKLGRAHASAIEVLVGAHPKDA